ncbi:MAG: DinB family protein [Vicinamibacterales bacterium]
MVAELNSALEFFNRSTGSLTEEDSTYTPVEGVFTAAQQVAHAAQTIEWFVDGAFAPGGFDLDFEGHERKVREVTSLSDARAWLAKSVEHAQAVVASKTDEEWGQPLPDGPVMGGQPRMSIFGAITDHTAHHRGALTIYARLRGKVPPMPYM